MKIKSYLDNLLFDLENFEPDTLTSIVSFVRKNELYNAITMLVRNNIKSALYLLNRCLVLAFENNPISDIKLAGLVVIIVDSNCDVCADFVSSISGIDGQYHWSKAMAASHLINKEVLSETVCKSA